MVDHIADKVIMITGAGGGFGRLVAEKTVARGAQVLAVDVDEAVQGPGPSRLRSHGHAAPAAGHQPTAAALSIKPPKKGGVHQGRLETHRLGHPNRLANYGGSGLSGQRHQANSRGNR